LANRTVELEVIPACAGYGMAFLSYSPIGGGVLGGILDKQVEDTMRSASLHSQQLLERQRTAVAEYEAFCRELGTEPAVVALAWILAQAGVTAVVTGPRTMAHFDSTLRSLELRLDLETLAKLEAIFPGPGGAAPEAYAW
jgi:aryl-alcohol dehydrogenase-like predicted oxidoreductase